MLKRKPLPIASPCGLALDDRNGQVVVAEYAATGGFDIRRAIIAERRAIDLLATDLRITLTKGNAHSDAPNLGLGADPSDELILRTLADRHDSLASQAFSRTLDNRVLITQVEKQALDEIVTRTDRWLTNQEPEHVALPQKTLRVETRTRAITRLWAASQGSESLAGTTAVLVISDYDYAIGLWSEATGLVYETEELFEKGAANEIKCEHARDVFVKYVGHASLVELGLPPVTNAVLSAAENYGDSMLAALRETHELQQIEIEPISIDRNQSNVLDQPAAFAIGSLLDHEKVPSCNLALSPQMRLDEIEHQRELQTRAATAQQAHAAALAILIPIAALLAFVIAVSIHNSIQSVRLKSRIEEEARIGQKLAQANADYESSKANFAAFQALLNNLITLRQGQPAAHQLLSDLNQRWPQDPSWTVQEINVKGANVEIKGRTKNEQAITSFAKSLEFSNGLFTGILTRNNVEGNSPTAGPQPQTQTPRSNLIEFTILSAYAPLAAPGKPIQSPNGQLPQAQARPFNPQPLPMVNPNSQPGMRQAPAGPMTPKPIVNQPHPEVPQGIK